MKQVVQSWDGPCASCPTYFFLKKNRWATEEPPKPKAAGKAKGKAKAKAMAWYGMIPWSEKVFVPHMWCIPARRCNARNLWMVW